jgi:hypothetical protein
MEHGETGHGCRTRGPRRRSVRYTCTGGGCDAWSAPAHPRKPVALGRPLGFTCGLANDLRR